MIRKMNAEDTLVRLLYQLDVDLEQYQKRCREAFRDEQMDEAYKFQGMMSQTVLMTQWINSHYKPQPKLSEVSEKLSELFEH